MTVKANNYADTIPAGALKITLVNGKLSYVEMGKVIPNGSKARAASKVVLASGKLASIAAGAAIPAGAKAWVNPAVIAALAAASAKYRYQTAYNDLQFALKQIPATSRYTVSRGTLEHYFQYLPALTRGITVPNGYPLLLAGLYGTNTNTFPRIMTLQPFVKDTDKIAWTNPNVNVAWAEKMAAAFPALAKIKKSDSAYFSTIRLHGKVAMRDSKGEPCAWLFRGAYFAVNWAELFDHLFMAGKIFADPTAYYWQQTYKAWLELDFFESTRNFAEAFVAAVGIAYAAAAAVGSSATGAAAGGSSTLAPTTVTAAAPSGESLTAISTEGSGEIGGTISTVSAGTEAGAGAVSMSTLADAAAGLTTAEKLVSGAKSILGGKASTAKPTTAKATTAKSAAQAGGSLVPAVAAIAAGTLGLILLIAVAQP